MAESSVTFPHKDEHGRAVSVAELTMASAGGAVVAFVGLMAVSGILALLSLGTFTEASGWLALILPALLFFDDLRGWRPYKVRFAAAFVAAVVAIALGLVAAGAVRSLPPLFSGAIGAFVAAVVYSPAWFFGVRWGTGQHSEMRSR
jgi:hypothetical protein